jgi:hypothetical protein
VSPLRFGAVGDVHGEFEALARVMARHPEVAFWVSVGDVASDDGRYPEPVAPLYWIKGNNEDFGFIGRLLAGDAHMENLRYLANGTRAEIGGLSVAALGGTFAPTWYDTRADALPFPGGSPPACAGAARSRAVRDDKRRHFVRAEVEACKAMRGIDLFLSHEAPRPFFVPTGRGRTDAGRTAINEVLHVMAPRLHLCGHHHQFRDGVRQGVRSVALDVVSRSYLLLDAATLGYERRET